jgi:hypothetical protein
MVFNLHKVLPSATALLPQPQKQKRLPPARSGNGYTLRLVAESHQFFG